MKKPNFNRSGMKQIIDSGFKTFDKQTNRITYGNVIANTQISSYIRSYNEMECNGRVHDMGYLQDFDLTYFKKYLADYQIAKVKELTKDKGGILYLFFTTNKNKKTDPLCYVLTDKDYKEIWHGLIEPQHKNFYKRYNALKEVMKYITI